MSIKDLFYNQKKYKVVTSSSLENLTDTLESANYINEYAKERQRYLPSIDFGTPENFAHYGSAEKYYSKSLERIYQQYPYDGSEKEKLEFQISSSFLDKWMFDNAYPRKNGHITIGQNWDHETLTDFQGDSNLYGDDTFFVSPNPQYVFIKGGSNAAAIRPYDGKSSDQPDFKNPEHKANLYDRDKNLRSNLLVDGTRGNTVEFWFKAGGTAGDNVNFLGPSPSIAFFDLWNSGSLTAGSDNPATYGRFLIEMRREASELDKLKGDNLFYLTIMSGNSGVDRAPIGAGNLTGSYPLDSWNHFAFTFQNNGNSGADDQLDLKLYINGELQDTVVTGTAIGEINEGPHLANIGAYIYAPNTASVAGWTAGPYSQEGIGCVSGSFDEFRFWKERRNSNQIDTYYNTQVGGGTNTDFVGQHLGVYFKFNEGITGHQPTDQNALDYSGRVSNGLIKNYFTSQVSGSAIRSEGSAIVSASAATKEFLDPILYPYHPEVQNVVDTYTARGREYDFRNTNALYNSIPEWIREEDENIQNVENLFQIISSYFDHLHMQIHDVPRLKDVTYYSGSNARPPSFSKELLNSSGFYAPEIFPNANIIELFLEKDKNGINFEKNLHDIKNLIYQNIYNNLSYINKSKGTSKSIRNLLRCFGVDDDVFKLNFYSNNQTLKPEGVYNHTAVKRKFADFSQFGRNNGVVFQSTASSNTNSSGFLNHSSDETNGFDADIGMTFETDVVFRRPPNLGDPNEVSGTFGYISSSMFGVHTAESDPADLSWATNDYGNFQVYAVRDKVTTPNSRNAYFQLKSTTGGILDGVAGGEGLISDLFYEVYNDTKWNFAVVVKPRKYPNISFISGSSDDYIVEFHGYSFAADLLVDQFVVSATVSNTVGKRFVSSKKRFYVGSHIQDFDGANLAPSDIKASGCKIWTIPLTSEEIIAHGRDITNYGVNNPEQSSYLFETKSTYSGYIPRIEALSLHWDFSTVTGSDGSGEFLVEDLSSGSSDSRFGDFSAILEKQHTGQGMFFKAEDTKSISNEYISTAKTQFFENLSNESMIEILDKDDEYFGGSRSRPIRYFFSLEKSMYQSINDEMIDFFAGMAGLQSYANMVGEPVNKYRQNYKKLDFVKRLFFDKIKNTPDLEKYTNFYHWLDDSVSAMVMNLVPATADFAGVQNIVESHILERNKYQHKFPTLDTKFEIPEGVVKGINNLKYNWKFGHAPTPPDGGGEPGTSPGNQNLNTLWWKNKAERNTDAPNNFGSGDSGVDNTRGFIHSASVGLFNRQQSSPFSLSILEFRKEGPKNYRAFFPHLQYDSTNVIEIRESGVDDSIAHSGSDDHKDFYPPKKFKAALFGNLGTKEGEETNRYLFPFNMFSSSLDTKVSREFKEGLIITDQHRDTYHTFENEPLQGPFTKTHVGGNQYRHISLNKGAKENLVERNRDGRLDDDEIRSEGWIIKFDDLGTEKRIRLVSPDFDGADKPRASYLRDETAKRPVNIRNIHYTTASQDLGNFTKNYEVVMTSGRDINNHYFKENLGVSVTGSQSTIISGSIDFTLPDRSTDAYRTKTVIAERFSAPGEPATLSRGYLDVESESFSVYNNLNYRNFTVRSALRTMLTASVVEYGLADDLQTIANDLEEKDPFRRANYHKVNKNSAKRIELVELNPDGNPASSFLDDDNYQTGSVSDNYYVQHQIPQSVMQYAWITASAISGPFGFEKPNTSYASMASDDITFVSASQHGAAYSAFGGIFGGDVVRVFGIDETNQFTDERIPIDFVGTNTVVLETLSSDTNTIEASLNGPDNGSFVDDGFVEDGPSYSDAYRKAGVIGKPAFLNAINLNRNGAGGYPSWKQWRVGSHPVARYHKNNNIISFVAKQTLNTLNLGGLNYEENLYSFKEAPIMSKFKPLVHALTLKDGSVVDLKSSYGNNLQIGLNQYISFNKSLDDGTNLVGKVNFKDFANIEEQGPTPAVFELRGDQAYENLKKLYITHDVIGENNPLQTEQPAEGVNANPAKHFIYKEVIWPKQKNAYLSKVRFRENYTQNSSDISSLELGQQRIFWKDALVDRLRTDSDTTLNSLGFKIDKDHTKGWPNNITSNVSGGVLVVNRVNPSPTTTVTASGGSAALSVWPLDTDGEGSAVYAYVSEDNEDSFGGSPRYYVGRGAGELSNSDDWTLYYKDFSPTASISYTFMQMLHFSGAYQTNDTGGSFGIYNKSIKLPTYQTPQLIGRSPWYSSYEEYVEDIKYMAKDYSIIPEFNISEHIEKYISENKPLTQKNSSPNTLELEGGNAIEKVPPGPNGTDTIVTGSIFNNGTSDVKSTAFEDTYVLTEPMNYYQKFYNDHINAKTPTPIMKPNVFSLSFDGIMKLLPYQGFYPVSRATQLATLFKESYANIGPEDQNDWPQSVDGLRNEATRTAALMQPWFNPGILFNSIKSGIAVDWPVFKGAQGFEISEEGSSLRGSGFISGSEANPTVNGITSHGGPNYRFKFESLYSDRNLIPPSGSNEKGKIVHLGPQWNQFGYHNTAVSSSGPAAGGVLEYDKVLFRFTGTPTNGTAIGFETYAGTKITGTVDTTQPASTNNIIGLSGVSSNTDVAQRFYDFLAINLSGNNGIGEIQTMFAEQAGSRVIFSSRYGSTNLDITDGNVGTTFIDNVTIIPASSSAGVKFSGFQAANESFFDLKGTSQVDPKFRYAMNNFLAETVNFFLKKKPVLDFGETGLGFISSKTSNEFGSFEAGKIYYMDLVMQKSKNFVMFEGPAAFQMPGSRVNFTGSARGIHYGPAMRWTNESSQYNADDEFVRNLADPAFAAYTPPYFYGTSIARFKFDPTKILAGQTSGEVLSYSIEDIQASTEIEFYNLCESQPEFAQLPDEYTDTETDALVAGSKQTPASASFMHMSSSFQLKGVLNDTIIKQQSNQNGIGILDIQDDKENRRWVIHPKFECPVMNFSGNAGPIKGTDVGSLTNLEKACFDSKGMWYGSGSLASESDGIKYALMDSFLDNDDPDKASLIEALGFDRSPRSVGSLADSKNISEAIVAIPMNPNGQFYDLDEATYKIIYNNILNGQPDLLGADGLDALPNAQAETGEGGELNIQAYLTKNIEKTSIGEMIRKMNKFVIPPHMDFRNPEIYDVSDPSSAKRKPFAMYIMEISHTLEQEDLQNIWQNVMPDIATRAKKVNKTISHQVGYSWEFFPNGLPNEDIRFVVFKVKQRAHNNYEATTPAASKLNVANTAQSIFKDPFDLNRERHIQYSYNWPYDFCSLVEMGKIEAGVKFEPVNKTSLQAGTNNNILGLDFPLKKYKEEQKTSKE